MSTFGPDGRIDPGAGIMVTCVGVKGSGKSVMGLLLARTYPADLVVIDVAADDGPMGPDVIELKGTVADLPRRWPEHLRREVGGRPQPMILRYVPDTGSSTHLEDMDAVAGLAYTHGDCCLLVHETGLVAPANRTPPHMRRILNANRHQRLTCIFCMPRPVNVDPLVLAQSDLVYAFDVPNPSDRTRIADTIGWKPADFDEAMEGLGPHEYLRFDRHEAKPASDDEPDLRLIHWPALPADDVAATLRWAKGQSSNFETAREARSRRARTSSGNAR